MVILPLIATGADIDQKNFYTLPISQAHEAGFAGCDEKIKLVFEVAGGSNIRVNADWFEESKGSAVRLTVIWGDMGDSVFLEAEFTKSNGNCLTNVTTILTSSKTCELYKQEMQAFTFVAQSLYTMMENARRAVMLLKPVNNGCMAIFQQSKKDA